MASANDLTAKLDAVIEGTEAQAVQTQRDEATLTRDMVSKAVAEALETQKAASGNDETTAKEKGGKTPESVPYERFSEVIGQKNEAVERLKALDDQFKRANEREDMLKTRVGELEQEHQILEAIRALSDDERYSDAVNKIDKALQGIEEEVEQAQDKGDEKAVKEAEKRFDQKAAELDDLIAEQRAESLWNEANTYAAALLDALPEEYTDADKQRLGAMWTPRVDWDGIEEAGTSAIPPKLQTSFAELIKEYGTPQGQVAKTTRTQVESEIPKDVLDRTQTPEALVKSVQEKDWGAKSEDGKLLHGDDEFAADLGKVLRALNQS